MAFTKSILLAFLSGVVLVTSSVISIEANKKTAETATQPQTP